MAFIIIDDVTLSNNDRVCFYFGFDNQQTIFAAKRSIAGNVNSIKANNYYDVFAWLGFSEIGFALFSSAKFAKKYRVNLTSVFENELLVGSINNSPVFFFKLKQSDDWVWTENLTDLIPPYGDDIEQKITQVMGKGFIEQYKEFALEVEAQKKAHESYLEIKSKDNAEHLSGEKEAIPA